MTNDPKLLTWWAKQTPLEVRTLPDGRTVSAIDDNDYTTALIRNSDGAPLFLQFALSNAAFEEFIKSL